jgi:predicted Zn finger-like uncharacterized protein
MCPTCGAVYNVAAKDIGRRIKCKKCGTSLEVRDSGLEIEDPNAPAPAPKPVDDLDDAADTPRKKRDRRPAFAIDPLQLLNKIGGIPTILFAFGLFIVLFTGFQDSIGRAKILRRQAAIDEAQAEINGAQRKYDEKKEHTDSETKELQNTREAIEKRKKNYEEDKTISELANKRSHYIDQYYLMLGFMLIAFGCVGYLLADYGLVLRIVAAVILLFMVMGFFKLAVGAGGGPGVNAGINLG